MLTKNLSRRFAALTSVAMLAACATTSTGDLRTSQPSATFTTKKEIRSVAACLAESLGRWGSPSIYDIPEGVAVSFTKKGNTLLLFDLSRGGQVIARRLPPVTFRAQTEQCL